MTTTYDYITKYTASPVNWKKGRQGNKIKGITIHWWGGSKHLDFMGIVKFLCSPRPNNPTSAHYVAQGVDRNGHEDRLVACIVDPDDTAYHAGNWAANLTEIGIENRPWPTELDYLVTAELIRGLRETYGNLPLYPHKHWTSTTCPGAWDITRLDEIARSGSTRAPIKKKEWDEMATKAEVRAEMDAATAKLSHKLDRIVSTTNDDTWPVPAYTMAANPDLSKLPADHPDRNWTQKTYGRLVKQDTYAALVALQNLAAKVDALSAKIDQLGTVDASKVLADIQAGVDSMTATFELKGSK